eukprot:TRINITY_DN1864_c1_g1_i1.p1 TRINITY_DN1864_c1_g1~~TRINITY_DN1864_c1_g1_i1.p1  ORF type:complete len:340 (+),score=93.78 TRINITY_DN1864_c1_g1_i1:147-1166(+)
MKLFTLFFACYVWTAASERDMFSHTHGVHDSLLETEHLEHKHVTTKEQQVKPVPKPRRAALVEVAENSTSSKNSHRVADNASDSASHQRQEHRQQQKQQQDHQQQQQQHHHQQEHHDTSKVETAARLQKLHRHRAEAAPAPSPPAPAPSPPAPAAPGPAPDAGNASAATTNITDPAQAEQELEKEETSQKSGGLMGALGKIGGAVTNPVGTLRNTPSVKKIEALLKVALDSKSKGGKCLMDDSDLDGIGCSDLHGASRLCECGRMLEMCYVPDDPAAVFKTFLKDQKAGLEEAKALVYGRCHRPLWLKITVAVVVLLVIAVGLLVVKKLTKKSRSNDDD